jgi:outer membrane lipoprotein-sorting protein
MTGTTRFRVFRWSAPALIAAAIGVAASGVLTADADPPLPARTAAQLLVDLQTARIEGLSGTIVQDSKLGLPELPNIGNGTGSSSLTALLTGSHTLKVWTAGPEKQRLALLGTLGESDVVHNGRDVWVWASDTNSVTHIRLTGSGRLGDTDPASPVPTALTPQQAADLALKAIDPTTAVTTDGTASVAGRAAYELVLRPRDTRSLIGQVRLAVDAQTHLPLRVQVFSKTGGSKPAFGIGFTRISFNTPGDEQFQFVTPPGATVHESTLGSVDGAPTVPKSRQAEPGDSTGKPGTGEPGTGTPGTGTPGSGTPAAPTHLAGAPRLIGTGWTTVAVFSDVQTPTASGSGRSGQDQLTALLGRLPRVSGAWGSGRLLTGTVFSALLTDDGRLLVGAVSPELLYQAAGQR